MRVRCTACQVPLNTVYLDDVSQVTHVDSEGACICPPSDFQRACQLFGHNSTYIPGVGLVGDAINEDAVELLKADPEEYFRLNRIWQESR